MLRPTVRAAQMIAQFDHDAGELDLNSLVTRLGEQVSAVQAGDLGRAEEMLVAHAHTLDMLFHLLVRRSVRNLDAGHAEAGDAYMRFALRTQSQCRATLETLAVVKNPPSVSFVRQANIANGPQQVNNRRGVSPRLHSPRAKIRKPNYCEKRVQ